MAQFDNQYQVAVYRKLLLGKPGDIVLDSALVEIAFGTTLPKRAIKSVYASKELYTEIENQYIKVFEMIHSAECSTIIIERILENLQYMVREAVENDVFIGDRAYWYISKQMRKKVLKSLPKLLKKYQEDGDNE